jgi:hypothetical protein
MATARFWRPGAVLLVGGSLLLAACGGTTGSSGASSPTAVAPASPVATATPSQAATESPPAEASPSAAGAGALCAVLYEPCPLEAGIYRSDPFVPAFTFAIDDGWTNDRNFADGGGLSKGPGGIYWSSGVSMGRVGESQVEFDSTIEGFSGHLASFDGFEITEGAPATIGGQEAVVIDLATGDTAARGLYLLAEDAYNLGPGEKVRLYLMEMDGVLVTFVVEAWMEADFDAVVAQSQPVLDSVVWD